MTHREVTVGLQGSPMSHRCSSCSQGEQETPGRRVLVPGQRPPVCLAVQPNASWVIVLWCPLPTQARSASGGSTRCVWAAGECSPAQPGRQTSSA